MIKKRFTLKPYDGITCDVFDGEIEIANVHRDDAKGLIQTLNELHEENIKLKIENEELKQVLGSILIEVRRDISATNHSGEVKAFVNPNSFDLISDILKKYGALKEWYE